LRERLPYKDAASNTEEAEFI